MIVFICLDECFLFGKGKDGFVEKEGLAARCISWYLDIVEGCKFIICVHWTIGVRGASLMSVGRKEWERFITRLTLVGLECLLITNESKS